jgi:hypothetical protein
MACLRQLIAHHVIYKGADGNQKQKTPIPPTVKKVTGNQQENVSGCFIFCDHPIKGKDQRKKYGKIQRVK